MKLLTQAIKRKLPKIYATESIPLEEKPIICKFFNPIGSESWYVIEGEEKEDDLIFFGLVDLHEQEFGYFSLNELESTTLPLGMKIERDIYFEDYKVKDVFSQGG